ncbi:MAG: Ppx/GppA phosphatase family protein [Actinomycetaceae bacterium]|nr:Ppx/GppA phosphatase family protein [Actinomycetaceae bacterium]
MQKRTPTARWRSGTKENALNTSSNNPNQPWLEGRGPGTVAAIDCGTNSIRLLIGSRQGQPTSSPGQGWIDHQRLMQIVRLGEGVDETGRLSPAAIERTVTVARHYAQLCREAQVARLRFVATSASRDASNRADFVTQIQNIFGIDPQVVEGSEEARLSFLGATAHLPQLQWPILVVDIGGGSTEFVYATNPDELRSISTNMGSVRVHEKFPGFAMGPDSDSGKAREWVEGVLATTDKVVDWAQVATIVGVAGTVTTVAAFALELDEYDMDLNHDSRFTSSQMAAHCERLMRMPVAQRGDLGFMPQGREDVIGAGAGIFQQILQRAEDARGGEDVPVVVSEYDILDGVALALLD